MIERLRGEGHITFTGRAIHNDEAPNAPSERVADAIKPE